MVGINVLSLFDGLSGGMVALERTGINVENYYSSEIDEYAIKISEDNYPNIIRLGDVSKWKSWKLPKIDLLIGGSPCTGFSVAGRGLNFDDPRSKLFFEYAKILKHLKKKNPNIKFMLENVKMKQEWQDVITKNLLGIEPKELNSSKISAQSRKRLYWANWEFPEPEDKGIILKDILESGFVDRDKSYCIDANYWKGGNPFNYFEKSRRQLVFDRPMMIGKANGIKGHDILKRVYSQFGKSPTLTAHTGGNQEPKVDVNEINWRKLTPLECERLQCLPDNFTKAVSNSRRYAAIGNGWTIDMIVHILKYSGLK
jgi:DNA-cytosine methyltransferase